MSKKPLILGIESSCDETAASLITENEEGFPVVLSNIVSSQVEVHKEFGGVVPELAARSHIEKIDWIVKKAIDESGRKIEEIIIKILGAFNIDCHSRKGFTGVWIGNKKIASIGIGCKRWITINGFSINIDCELENFNKIVPCGIENCLMANMIDYNKNLNIQEVKRIVKKTIEEEFNFDFISK